MVVVIVALVPAAQVVRHAFAPPQSAPATPFRSCSQGVSELYQAVSAAREAAQRGMEEALGDEQAVRLFRAAVEPAWERRDEVAALCAGTSQDRRALDTIERLRYAEEHAVRSHATELQLLRRHAREVVGLNR